MLFGGISVGMIYFILAMELFTAALKRYKPTTIFGSIKWIVTFTLCDSIISVLLGIAYWIVMVLLLIEIEGNKEEFTAQLPKVLTYERKKDPEMTKHIGTIIARIHGVVVCGLIFMVFTIGSILGHPVSRGIESIMILILRYRKFLILILILIPSLSGIMILILSKVSKSIKKRY